MCEITQRLGVPLLCGVEVGMVRRRVEQRMTGTAGAVAVPEVMVVTVHHTVRRQTRFREVRVARAVEEFVEQPVRRAAMKPLAAIGVEG
jgi:hypothetical protein